MATVSAHRPPPRLYDLDVTIVSAKHLKNVNWRNGDLHPYIILWVDPDRRHATKPDDSGSGRSGTNAFFSPSPSRRGNPPSRSKFSTPNPRRPRSPWSELSDSNCEISSTTPPSELGISSSSASGRPHGKIRLNIGLIERLGEGYHPTPASSYYYSSAPPPPMPYRGYSLPPPTAISPPPLPPPQPYYSYSDPHSGYYPSYYSAPAPAPRPFLERQSHSGPSAPVDYTPYDYHRRSGGKMGMGAVA